MEQIHRLFPVKQAREFTVEAGRPDSVTAEKLHILYDAGVGRISINPQTMHDETLRLIGRNHTVKQVKEAFSLAREAGFSNINMDMITGLPGEDVTHVRGTLEEIFSMRPESLTVHSLAIKRSSRLRLQLEQWPLPDAATTEQMIESGAETAKALGMRPYYMYRQKYMRGNLENVGYAKPKAICLYNVDMMEETTSILAHGAGAMSKRIFGGERRVERIPNPKDIETYIAKLSTVNQQKRSLFGLE